MKICVIIPTLNEDNNIIKIFNKIKKTKIKLDILFIDDDSTDKTQSIIRKLKKKYKSVYYIFRKNKTGIGSAHKEGIKYAVFVSETAIHDTWDLETGAHRSWTENYRGNKVPAFVVSPFYHLDSGENVTTPLTTRRARIKANPASSHRLYSMQDVADQCIAALKDDPYYEGRNPSGKMPRNDVKGDEFSFNDLVDDLYSAETFVSFERNPVSTWSFPCAL